VKKDGSYNRSLQNSCSLFHYGLKPEALTQRVRLTPTRREYIPVGSTPASLPATVGLKPDPL